MLRSKHPFLRSVFPALAAIVLVVIAGVPASAQTTSGSAEIKIDAPAINATINNGSEVDIGGWALDPAGPAAGIDQVRIYLDGPMDSGGMMLGQATYGKPRPDVAVARGNPAFANSGYDYVWRPRNLPPGPHQIYVYAHSVVNGWSSQSITVMGSSQGGGPGGPFGPNGRGPNTPYGGNYLANSRYGLGGTGAYPYGVPPCSLPSSYLDPRCPPPPPPPPPLFPPIVPAVPGVPGVIAAPTGVTPIGVTGTTVTLTWTAVPGATSYRVLQSIGNTGIYAPAVVTNQTGTSALVTGLLPVTQYMFEVVGVDVRGAQGSPSTPITVMTTAGP